MAISTYHELLHQIERLTEDDQLRLLGDLAAMIRQKHQPQEEKPRLHSVLALRGLGKEVWEGIDVDQYIEEERNSWNRDD